MSNTSAGLAHGGLAGVTGVIRDGDIRLTVGVILFRLFSRGRDWAQASALASNVPNSTNCLCNFFIAHQSGGRLRQEHLTLPKRRGCQQITEVDAQGYFCP